MRTIVLSADWDARLFWRDAESRDSVDETTLQISPGLRQRLNDYYRHWDLGGAFLGKGRDGLFRAAFSKLIVILPDFC